MIRGLQKLAILSLTGGVVILLLCSCPAPNYMDLLTGGDVKFWDFGKHSTILVSFNKKTQRIRYYDDHLNIYNINENDSLSQGLFFKIEGDTIFTSWIVRQDTMPIDYVRIRSISKRKMCLNDYFPIYLFHHPLQKK